jgi:hypothetical protein
MEPLSERDSERDSGFRPRRRLAASLAAKAYICYWQDCKATSQLECVGHHPPLSDLGVSLAASLAAKINMVARFQVVSRKSMS